MALYGFVGVVGGMGVAPTLVALVTDRVFHDESKLYVSLVLVTAPAFLLSTLLAGLALRRAGRLREAVSRLEIGA